MDELDPIREQIWQRQKTRLQEQVKKLEEARAQQFRIAILCGVMGIAVSAVAMAARGAWVFFVVAGYFFFFAWNRRMESLRTAGMATLASEGLAAAENQDPARRGEWVEKFWAETLDKPAWEKVSNWIAIVTAVLLWGFVQIMNFITSGTGMRVFFATTGVLIAAILLKVWNMRRRMKHDLEPMQDEWNEIT